MTLWRLELLRLFRTSRWLILLGAYVFFGAVGPLTARYMEAIFENFGTDDITIVIGAPQPLDGLAQFVSNASQIGLLAIIIVAAAALALDARPEIASFLRTRVSSAKDLILPRYVVVTAASSVALIAGTVVAALLTSTLIGSLPVGPVVLGTLFGALYLAFVTAVVAAVAGIARSQVMVVFSAILLLLALPLLGMLDVFSGWLPSELLSSVLALVDGVPASEFVAPAIVSVVATAGLLLLAVQRAQVREL